MKFSLLTRPSLKDLSCRAVVCATTSEPLASGHLSSLPPSLPHSFSSFVHTPYSPLSPSLRSFILSSLSPPLPPLPLLLSLILSHLSRPPLPPLSHPQYTAENLQMVLEVAESPALLEAVVKSITTLSQTSPQFFAQHFKVSTASMYILLCMPVY